VSDIASPKVGDKVRVKNVPSLRSSGLVGRLGIAEAVGSKTAGVNFGNLTEPDIRILFFDEIDIVP